MSVDISWLDTRTGPHRASAHIWSAASSPESKEIECYIEIQLTANKKIPAHFWIFQMHGSETVVTIVCDETDREKMVAFPTYPWNLHVSN